MSLDKATVLHIARLARIALKDDEVEPLADELSGILAFVEQLERVNTDDVEPMTSVFEMGLRRRADEVSDGGQADAALANAPEGADGFFAVPKVIE